MPTPPEYKTEDNFALRVLNRIADEHLVPRPQWEFAVQNYLFWGLGAVAVVLGAFAFSEIIFEMANVDWRLALVTHGSLFSFFLDAAPVLWVGALALFILIGYANVRRTNHGYRYSLTLIAFGSIMTSMALGTALYASGFGNTFDDVAGHAIPFHQSIEVSERGWWLVPEKGLLGGFVVSVNPNEGSFVLRDFKGVLWQVTGDDLRTPDLTTIARGGTVRVVGVPVVAATSSIFHACFVLPWKLHPVSDGVPPPQLVVFASTSERNSHMERSEICRDIRPYQQLRDIDLTGF